jgi:hypothetical protein
VPTAGPWAHTAPPYVPTKVLYVTEKMSQLPAA